MKKSAAEVWCRGCRHYGYEGQGPCDGVLDRREAEETPPCVDWGGNIVYEPTENGEPNW